MGSSWGFTCHRCSDGPAHAGTEDRRVGWPVSVPTPCGRGAALRAVRPLCGGGRGCWVGGAAEHKASGKALAPGQLTCSGSGPPVAGSAGVQRRRGWTAKCPWPTPLGHPPGVPCRVLRAPCTGLRAQIATRTRSSGNGRRWRGAPARCPLSLPQADTGPCWCCRPLRPHGPRPLLRRARHCSHSLRSGGGKTPNH